MKPHKTTCKITLKHDNGDLEDFPCTEDSSISFNATDLTMCGWIQQFKKVLAVVGFSEKTIEDHLGAY
mgnify:CR=1 FL=1